LVVVFAALAGLLVGCRSEDKPRQAQTVTLAMGYIPNVQFAPFYVAI
jgi:hypothetical protein